VRKQWIWRWYGGALIAADASLLGLAFLLAAWLRGALGFLPYQPTFEVATYALVALGVIPGLLAIFWLRGAYARHHLLGGPEEYARIVSGCTYGTLLLLAASYLFDTAPTVSRGWLLLFWLLAIVLVGAGRFTLRRIAYYLRRRGWLVRRVVIAGANDHGLSIAQQLHGPAGQGAQVVGFLDDYLPAGTALGLLPAGGHPYQSDQFRVLGHPRGAAAIASGWQCDLLIVVQTALSWESQQLLARLALTADRHLEMRLAPTPYDLTAAGVESAPLGYIPLLRLQPSRLVGVDAVLRATCDLAVAAVLLIVLAPALGWLVLAARQRGIRPVLVRRQVLGQGARDVTFSMVNPRITRHFLLRGLPALMAVMRGELALVGPRPVLVEEQAAYERWLGILTTVRPGLTGPWRLTELATATEEATLMDVWWVRNWTIWRHLFVLFQTGGRILSATRPEPDLTRWGADQSEDRPEAKAASRVLASEV
jgi:lipopolysaccharide/colanic/teichoic acid biosynthesis glycosyltransferase